MLDVLPQLAFLVVGLPFERGDRSPAVTLLASELIYLLRLEGDPNLCLRPITTSSCTQSDDEDFLSVAGSVARQGVPN